MKSEISLDTGIQKISLLRQPRCQSTFLYSVKLLTYCYLSVILLLRIKEYLIKSLAMTSLMCVVKIKIFLVGCQIPTTSYSARITITTEKYWTQS